jgi:hypothetical protein
LYQVVKKKKAQAEQNAEYMYYGHGAWGMGHGQQRLFSSSPIFNA